MIYLVRHGEADYSYSGRYIFSGFGTNFAPLSQNGIKQIERTAADERFKNTDVIVSSPFTRALQSAAIIAGKVGAPVYVEPLLYEWVADKQYRYLSDETAKNAYDDFFACNGVYPDGEDRDWENMDALRDRILPVIQKYSSLRKLIVVSHRMLISSVYRDHFLSLGEAVAFDPSANLYQR